jgi:putative phage-type endonuclease
MMEQPELQRTAEWFAAKCGKVSASRLYDAIARQKNGNYYATRETYKAELVTERLTGVITSKYVNGAMQWGIDHEPEACAGYAIWNDHRIETVGFVDHPTIPMAGASPDRRVDDDGLLEAKCPETRTHIATLLGAPPDDRYLYQMQWQMACEPGRVWCDFVSYDPRLPGSMQLSTPIRVDRNDALIAEMEKEVRAFNAEINVIINELKDRYDEAA